MHKCNLDEGQTGRCRGRGNKDGSIVCTNYGHITSYALDPIEKKPLRHFYPGSNILSVGSYGCSMSCSFCQNHEIAAADRTKADYQQVSPKELVSEALRLKNAGNIGLAFTYNEPIISYEYVLDCAVLAREAGLKNVMVTNGCASMKIVRKLLPHIDAFNIDLKAFTPSFYEKMGGAFSLVLAFIKEAAAVSHVEVTTLVITGENDTREEIENAAKYLAAIDKKIPYHISRFFPCYHYTHKTATKVETVYDLAQVARRHLSYVYTGNC